MPYAEHSAPRDVYDEAMIERPAIGFGKVTINAYRVVLIKGQGVRGKVPYDPTIHDPLGLRVSVAVDFVITPLDATRPVISVPAMLDWTREFKDVVRPSLQLLGPKIAAIRDVKADDPTFNVLWEATGLFFKYEWVLRPDNKAGETWKTICFRDVYPNEASCKEAAKKEGAIAENLDDTMPFPSDPQPSTADLDAKREALRPFLSNFWTIAKGDKTVFALMLTKEPFNGLFTMDSPEVKAAMIPF